MKVVIRVTSGVSEGRSVMLRSGQSIRIGRTEWADFAVPYDESISSVHFSVHCEADHVIVQDLGSSNGTLVNEVPVDSAELKSGDQITAGRTAFVVELDAARQPASSRVIAPGPTVVEQTQNSPEGLTVDRNVTSQVHRTTGLEGIDDSRLPFRDGLNDVDPSVRRTALLAAARSRQRWLKDHCRRLAKEPLADAWDAYWLLAILGEPADLAVILRLVRDESLGSRRYSLLASYGHPGVFQELFEGMQHPDLKTSVAAGFAYAKLTGVNVESNNRVELPPEDGNEPTEFEREFLDQAYLPDRQRAQQHWANVQAQFADCTRIRQGVDISDDRIGDVIDQLDMEARWEACLRANYEGQWDGRLADLVRFPFVPGQ